MRIGINTTLNTNIGDDFIREGILFLLSKKINLTNYEIVKGQKHTTNKWNLAEVHKQINAVKQCDIIIQSGAPVFWPDVAYMHQNEWNGLFWRQGKSKSIIALASGSCYPPGWSMKDLTKQDREFISIVVDRSKLLTVRDEMALQVVRNVKPDTVVHLFPCTAFWASEALNASIEPKYAVLNYMDGASHFWQTEHVRWRKLASQYYVEATKKFGRCILVCHDKKETTLAKHLGINSEFVFYSEDYKDYAGIYSKAIIGLVNRVHGGMFLAGCGIPVMNVGIDSRLLVNKFVGVRQGGVGIVCNAHTGKSIVDSLYGNRQYSQKKMQELKEKYTQPYANLIKQQIPDIS